ncbi:MAG: hypothetical protein KGO94_11155 [Alphaproteobacteria bacterium]|nr:hypothetical protein [Alphaproteobacteria bacterium]
MKTPVPSNADSPDIILGRECFEKFSAVEGIFLTRQEKQLRSEMDLRRLSNDERRALILASFKEAV